MKDGSAPRARDALGMPVPPAAVVSVFNRLRVGLGRGHDAMAPGFQLTIERLFGLIDAKAIYAAVELDLPDRLAAGARSAADLAAEMDADADAVERLLRFLVSRGVFRRTRDGRFANNGASDPLRADHPYSWRGWVEFFGSDWNGRIFDHLADRVRTGTPASRAAYGVPFFEYLNDHNPDAGAAFNAAMAAGARLQSLLLAENLDWASTTTVCDVGGGTGAALANILRVHPQLSGVVLDLPALADEAETLLRDAGVGDRARFEGGDFFAAVPGGFDAYLMLAVVHDWDDESCRRILGRVREAMTASSRLMVVERPIAAGNGADFSKAADMLMLVLGEGGRERTRGEYEALFASADLHLVETVRLPSLFEVFVLTR